MPEGKATGRNVYRFIMALIVLSEIFFSSIVNVRGRVRFGIRPIYRRVSLNFIPKRETIGTWKWDTARITVPPYIPIEIQLKVKDAQSNTMKSPIYVLTYEDNRFSWRERRSQHLLVRWYEGSDTFGDDLFALARDALSRQMSMLAGTVTVQSGVADRPFLNSVSLHRLSPLIVNPIGSTMLSPTN